ncbi:cytochrome P450 [Bradyrhizobium sp. AUGA SZCCT0169]|uniref:cytochrome P450 n=1 Tax=Bradyrhizobium sp. AUGA SZCCT0169 TaxID=2807663 RepID=UPI001BAAD50A|nr:cytochrome P450 [Bradyrhizobium sp. AUGA SZCCT0169]MBR1249934.1 cytochrome P450 [Bradyrhizobium sp. AUGA SZCCT0169]
MSPDDVTDIPSQKSDDDHAPASHCRCRDHSSGRNRLEALLRCGDPAMKNTVGLLKSYEFIYGFAVAIVLVASGLAIAAGLSFRQPWFFAALAPFGLLALCVALRWREFRRYAHIPGPKPSFFLGSLRSLLLHEHGARDRALVELHRLYGPVVRVHMAWGNTPFVSLSVAPKELGQKDMDSNRVADNTVLPRSLMGLKRGERHTAHRQQMNPHFTPKAVQQGACRLEEVSTLYLRTWRSGNTQHGSLKADLHHWSANSLGSFLCGEEWEQRTDLSAYLAAIGELEEAISFRAFHPFFVRGLFPVGAGRARTAYRYLFDHLEAALERRLQRRLKPGPREDALGRLVNLKLAPSGGKASWSHEECVEELISLVAGGTDAMSYTMAQALYLLSRNPDVQDEARARVLQAGDAGKRAGDPFVLNVLHETMRLFPPVPFSSKISETRSMEVEGINIPAKTNVMWMKTAVGLNEAFFADARLFNPCRFAAGPGGERPAESIASAMPFGAGARHCIGRHQAEYLLTYFLSAVLREFELVPMSDVAVTFSATVSVTPSAVPVRLVPRQVASRREAGLEHRISQFADGALRLNRDPAIGCPARLSAAP